ncbi:LAFA_0C01574g1_1 [Lachancea sp. 'fantastica']|nr:LAFA_0C01574g1_1 [Lachancea sp. 'fantastica']
MTTQDIDPAVRLADDFKKRGCFDEEKGRILAAIVDGTDGTSVEEFVRGRTATLVNKMVQEDESLIFKNRGSTSALIEGRLVKNGFEELNTESVHIDAFLRNMVEDPAFKESLKNRLRAKWDNELKEKNEMDLGKDMDNSG